MPFASRFAGHALFLAALAASSMALAFGERDPGYASATVKENGFCTGSLAAFADGSALVNFSGWEQDSTGIAKLLPDGSIDAAWGQAGRVMGVGGPLVRTPDGGLLASQVVVEGQRFLRLTRDGRVDQTYGTEGRSDPLPAITVAILQPDGALVAQVTTRDGYLAFARLDPHGRLDASFGSGGVLVLPLGPGGVDRVYAWGVEQGGAVQVAYHPVNEPMHPKLHRFPSGFASPDVSDGRLVPRDVIAAWLAPRAKVQPDGALVIADMCTYGSCSRDSAIVARFDANGATDLAFGDNGRTTIDILDPMRGLSSRQEPVALLAGERGRYTLLIKYLRHSGGTFGYNPTGLAAVQLTANGSLDPGFPNGLKVTTDTSSMWAQLDDGRLLVEDELAANACKVTRLVAPAPRAEAVVVEYYRTDVDQYFMAPEGAETVILDNMPASSGWVRTGQTFGAWLNIDLPGATPICRFYADVPGGSGSHFFTPQGPECDSLRAISEATPAGQPAWRFEGIAFRAREPAGGGCPVNLAPVYRVYNNGFALGKLSNHRFTTDAALYARMQDEGWIAEGVRFCVPPASRSAVF